MPYYINPVTGDVTKITKAQKGSIDEYNRSQALVSLLGSTTGPPTVAFLVLAPVATVVLYMAAKAAGKEVWEFWQWLVGDIQDLRRTGTITPGKTGAIDIFIATLLEVTGLTKTPT